MTEQGTTYQDETEARIVRTPIFISGLPGKMATLIAEALAQNESYDLLPQGMSSRRHNFEHFIVGERKILLRDFCPNNPEPGTIAIDFTTPQNATLNAIRYSLLGIPFVMGTSGGDRTRLADVVRNSEISAVIATNMDPQIVGRQIEIDDIAVANPGLFEGATVRITEIHQPSKKDVSGTAIAFRTQYESHGALPSGEIESIRDDPDSPRVQEIFGNVDLDQQKGYAYHHVVVTDSDGNTIHDFETRVIGREVYVVGTLMAVSFLVRKMREGSKGEVFTMSDVIEDARGSA